MLAKGKLVQLLGNQFDTYLLKLKMYIPYIPGIPLLGIHSKARDIYENIYGNNIHNSK